MRYSKDIYNNNNLINAVFIFRTFEQSTSSNAIYISKIIDLALAGEHELGTYKTATFDIFSDSCIPEGLKCNVKNIDVSYAMLFKKLHIIILFYTRVSQSLYS